MTVAQWFAAQPAEKQGRARILLQVTCAIHRGAGGNGRWPSFDVAVTELDATMAAPQGSQWEMWQARAAKNAPSLRALGWDAAKIRAAWQSGSL